MIQLEVGMHAAEEQELGRNDMIQQDSGHEEQEVWQQEMVQHVPGESKAYNRNIAKIDN